MGESHGWVQVNTHTRHTSPNVKPYGRLKSRKQTKKMNLDAESRNAPERSTRRTLVQVTAFSYEKQRRTRNNILFQEVPTSVPEAREDVHKQLDGVHQSLSRSETDARHETLHRSETTGLRNELFDERKKEQRQGCFKEAYPTDGGIVGRNVIATCETCSTRCQHMWCNIRWAFDPVRSQSQLQTHLFDRRLTAAFIRQKDASRNLHATCVTSGRRVVR